MLSYVKLGQVRLCVHVWTETETAGIFKICQAKKCRVVSDGSIFFINLLEFKIFDNFNCRKCQADWIRAVSVK